MTIFPAVQRIAAALAVLRPLSAKARTESRTAGCKPGCVAGVNDLVDVKCRQRAIRSLL